MKTIQQPKFTITAGLCFLALLLALPARAATITWNGGNGTGYDLSQSTNWVGGVIPNVATPDIAQWDGSVAGVLSLTNLGAGYAGIAGNVGIDLNVTASQTSALKIDSNTNTAALRMSNLTIANGAGAVTLGDGIGTFNLTLGGVAGSTQTWTSDSASAATVNSDVIFGLGGGGTHTFALAGAGNWTLNNIIGGAINVTKTGTGTATLTGANTFSGNTTVTLGTLTMSGSLSSGAGTIVVNPASGTTATLNLFGSVTRTAAFNVGTVAGGTGIVNVNSATTFSPGTGTAAIIIGNAGFGVYNQTGGTVTSGQYLVAGITGVGAVGIMNISGGTFSPKAGNNGGTVGATAGTTGQLNMTGTGSYTSTDTTASGASGIYIGESGVGTLNLSGSATMTLGGVPSSAGLRIGANAGAFGVVNLGAVINGGGTITTMRVGTGSSAAKSDLNFHGGTLKASVGATTNFMNGLTVANVYGEGAVIDDNSQTIYIGQSLLAPAGNGVNSINSFTGGSGYTTAPYVTVNRGSGDTTGQYATAISQVDLNPVSGTFGQITNVVITNPGINYTVAPTFTVTGGTPSSPATITGAAPTANVSGGLTKNGAGTTILAGANTFTNTTTINAGRMVLAGPQYSSRRIVVSDGAKLSVALPGSTQLTPAAMTVGTNTGATLEFTVSSTSQAPLAPGTLTLNGVNTINVVAGNFLAGNSYPLVTYTTLAGAGSYTTGTLPGGVTGIITTVGNTITLNVTAVTNTIWTGLVNGTWDINTTANWTNTGTLGNKYLDGGLVQFDDTGINTVTVTNAALIMTPGAITVTNVTKNYAIKNVIAGSGGIVKTGAANLTNSAANTYTGPTVINQGKVAAGVASVANISGALGINSAVSLANDASAVLDITGFATQIGSLTGGGATGGNVILGAATLTVGGNNSSPAAFNGSITGTGGLTKIGAGTLTLGGTNTYSAATTVNGGTLTYPSSAVVNSAGAIVVGTGSGGAGSGGTGTVNINGSAISFGNVVSYVGYLTGNGILNFNGGALSIANELRVGGSDTSGLGITNGYGTFNMSAGTVQLSALTVARGNNNQNGVSGEVNISGGTLTSTNDVQLGFAGTGLGKLTISGSGIVNIGTTAGLKWLIFGKFDTSNGQLDMNGGQLNLMTNSAIKFSTGNTGTAGINVINQNGGTIAFYSDAGLTLGGTGDLNLAESGSAVANNTYNLNGGALIVPKVASTTTLATRTFNFNGGTLKPTAASTNFFDLGTGNTAANIRNGGAVIDTTNFIITIAQPLVHSTIGGDNATDGGLTKLGAGTLTLTGAASYSGPTKVLGGTLSLNGSLGLASGGDLIVSNATLLLDASSGSAMSVNNLNAGTGSILNLSQHPNISALNVSGNLTLSANSTISLNYGVLNANPTAAGINASGSLIKGTNIVINVSALGLGVGLIPLITDAVGIANTNGFVLGTLPTGVKAVLTNSTANSLDLLVTGAGQLLSWHGVDANNITATNWNINASTNWLDLNVTPSKYLQYSGNSYGDNVIFGDNGVPDVSNTNSVNLPAAVVPATVIFSANSYPYRLAGAGGIGGATSVTLTNGTLAVYLETSNSYTGGTIIGSGTLVITNDNAFGAAAGGIVLNGGALQLNNNVTNSRSVSITANATIGVNSTSLGKFNGVISGSGVLTKNDNGTLTLGGNNTFVGSTLVSAGTLNFASVLTNTTVTVGNVSSINAKLGISGNVTANSLLVGNNSGAAASVIQTGGNSLITGGGGDCMSVGNFAGAYGYYNAAGGTLTVNGIAVGGENNTGAGFSGTGGDGIMEINGGVVNNVGWLVMARGATAETGILNVFSGSLAFAGGGLQPNWGTGQTSIINILGGSVSSTNVPVNFRVANNTGILNLNGGVLQPTAVTGFGVMNFNGGTLIPATSFATPFLNLSSNVYVYSGGAKIDDNGQTLTISQPLLTPTGYGASSITVSSGGSGYIAPPIVTISGGSGGNATAIATVSGGVVTGITVTSPGNGYLVGEEASMSVNVSGGGGSGASATVNPLIPNVGGGLVKKGAGILTLSGTNNYAGTTVVTNGELLLTPAYQAGGTVVVADNAKFGIAASSVSNSATIGALTLGSSGASTLDFTYGFAGNPTNVSLTAGAVTLNGTSSIRIGGSFTLGTFPVLKYASLSGSFNSTVSAPRGMGASVSNDTVNKVIYVKVTSLASPIIWTGTNSIAGKTNLWDLNTTTNWLIAGSATTYQETLPPGDAVVFNDLGTGLVLLSNTASPASITISNSAVNYTFQGSGQVNAAVGLTKVGSGSVTLNLPGNYAVNTVISNGTVNIGTNQTFGSLSGDGSVVAISGTPTLTVNSSTNTTFSGSLQGAMILTKTGTSTLTLTGTNAFTGNLFGKAGTILLDSGVINGGSVYSSIGQVGTDSATMTLKGTGTFTNNNDFNVADVDNTIGTLNISNNASLVTASLYVASANNAGSTANGTVNQTGGAVQNTFTVIGGRIAGSTNGVGVYNMSGGTLTIPAAGSINVGRFGTGTLNMNGSASVSVGTGISYVGYRLGKGTLNMTGGSFSAGGDLRVGGSDVNGITNVATGTVIISNATMSVGSLTVARGNFLDNAIAGSVTLKNGGTLICTNDAILEFAGTGLGKMAIDGGTFVVGTAAIKWLMVGYFDAGAGELDITNGNLFLENGSSIKMCRQGNTGGNVVNQVGGNVTFYSDAGLTVGGGGALDLNYAGGASSTSTYNLNGGTLAVPQIIMSSGTGSGTLNLNGGTLKAAAGSATFMQGVTAANVQAGGAIIDTAGNNITIGQALLDGGTGGGLIKNGNGTLTLNGINTYTGSTVVNAGLLGGTGTIVGAVPVAGGAGLAPGDGAIGTLTVNGNITLNGLSTNVFEVNGSTPANDRVVAGAAVTYGGALKIVPTGTFTVGQQFLLFTGVGATNTSNFANVQSTNPGLVFSFTNGVLKVVSTVNTTPTNITAMVNGSNLELTWPADHTGWRLQAQTNSLSTGLGTNWVDVPNTATVHSVTNTPNPASGTVFYRMVYP